MPTVTERPPTRRMLWLGLAMIAAAVLGALVVRLGSGSPPWQGLDDAIHRAVRDPRPAEPSAIGAGATVLNSFDGLPGLILLLAVLAILAKQRRWTTAFYAGATTGVGVAVTGLIKNLGGRGRPADALVHLASEAYPSGHSALAACFVVVIAAILPQRARRRWWPIGVALLAAMMFSRMYVAVHWFTDTLAGALLGAGIALVLWHALRRRIDAERPRPRARA